MLISQDGYVKIHVGIQTEMPPWFLTLMKPAHQGIPRHNNLCSGGIYNSITILRLQITEEDIDVLNSELYPVKVALSCEMCPTLFV